MTDGKHGDRAGTSRFVLDLALAQPEFEGSRVRGPGSGSQISWPSHGWICHAKVLAFKSSLSAHFPVLWVQPFCRISKAKLFPSNNAQPITTHRD